MNELVSRGTADTIAAIATPAGMGGIGIVRVSGPLASAVMHAVVGRALDTRRAVFVSFRDEAGSAIDQGIALHFRAPNSYTGEDLLELQGHGGPVVMARLLRRCIGLGCRLARPGEFTERAFLNDKLDLAQAEGVADLIEAGSEEAARSAARTLTGEFSNRVRELNVALTELRVHAEGSIDFPEEEIDLADRTAQLRRLHHIRSLHAKLMLDARQGRVLRDGLTVVLIGRPNVGKSSLLNCLAGEDLAIVTPIAGTTRDHVRASIHLEGVPIHLIDTAGLHETDDVIEKIGIARTWSAINVASAVLLIAEAGEMAGRAEAEILQRVPAHLPIAWVYNKIDLYRPIGVPRETTRTGKDVSLFVSALTGEGIGPLREWLLETAGWHVGNEGVFLARERHLVALAQAQSHLESAAEHLQQHELFTEDLRLAHRALSAIIGEFTSDDLLGEIFRRFCIGK